MNIKTKINKFGNFLSNMIMPNIGAFIAWGLITSFFIKTGWFPNEELAKFVDPMLKYLLPILIAYTGGGLIAKQRGSIIASIAVMGVIVGSDIAMIISAMIIGPIAGYVIKKFDELTKSKIPSGFEMLVNNFSVGILGMILAIISFYIVGPTVTSATYYMEVGVKFIVAKGLIPILSIFIEPAKVLFLNNAINHGVFSPIGINEVKEFGKSIMFLLESNPGPGLGILLSYCMFGKKSSKESAPGAAIIHFFGGIHEIYFPYILINPILIIALILGGMSGIFIFSLFSAGLAATPSPGSIFAIIALSPKGNHLPILLGIVVSTIVTFLVASPFIKKAHEKTDEIKNNINDINVETLINEEAEIINNIVFACDAGMGSSVMGASRFKQKIKDLPNSEIINITNSSVDEVSNIENVQIVVTHKNLSDRVKNKDIEIIEINNFLKDENLDILYNRIKEQLERN